VRPVADHVAEAIDIGDILLFDVFEDSLQRLKVAMNVADDCLHAWLSPGSRARSGPAPSPCQVQRLCLPTIRLLGSLPVGSKTCQGPGLPRQRAWAAARPPSCKKPLGGTTALFPASALLLLNHSMNVFAQLGGSPMHSTHQMEMDPHPTPRQTP